MRDKSHKEQVERWARFVRDNPISKWKPEVKKIVDSQIIMANRFYKRLARTKEGRKKIRKIQNDKSNNL